MAKIRDFRAFDSLANNVDKHLQWLCNVSKEHEGYVKVTDGIEDVYIPDEFYTFCIEHGMDVKDVIRVVLNDFLIRLKGSRDPILYRIRNAKISDELKSQIFKIALGLGDS